GFFSSLVTWSFDGADTSYAADISSPGQMALVWSRLPGATGPDRFDLRATQRFVTRCVRTAEEHGPPPALGSSAESCVLLASHGKPGPRSDRERLTYDAARAQLARALYPSVIEFRRNVDRLRTAPDLDVAAIRRELTALEPTLQRVRDDGELRNADAI